MDANSGPRSAGQGTASLDVMNDSVFSGSSKGHRGSFGEGETCRICRGEGTKTEPLFHPCKCSGSIKYVHQDCLMEWLSHSHKKYCELCKTHFRFTKLYDPHMPESLPTPIFLRRLLSRAAKALITWSRFVLVCLVWLGWLPWSMRAGWRFLFWLGDGGWAMWHTYHGRDIPPEQALSLLKLRAGELGDVLVDSQTSLVSRSGPGASAIPTTLQAMGSSAANVAQAIHAQASRSPTSVFLHRMLASLGFINPLPAVLTPSLEEAQSLSNASYEHPSLLSNVSYLRSLTPSAAVNKLVIDILEGQVITLLVVLAFVLVFLIREWVVQQQFGVNIGIDLNDELVQRNHQDDAAQADAPTERPAAETDNGNQERGLPPHERSSGSVSGDTEDASATDVSALIARSARMPGSEQLRLVAGPARQVTYAGGTDAHQPATASAGALDIDQLSEIGHVENVDEDDIVSRRSSVHSHGSSAGLDTGTELQPQRPHLPERSRSSIVTQIRRLLEEEGRAGRHPSSHEIALDILSRSDGSTKDFFRLVRAEGRVNEISWLRDFVERVQKLDDYSDPDESPNVTLSGTSATEVEDVEQNTNRAETQPEVPAARLRGSSDESKGPVTTEKGKQVARDHPPASEPTTEPAVVPEIEGDQAAAHRSRSSSLSGWDPDLSDAWATIGEDEDEHSVDGLASGPEEQVIRGAPPNHRPSQPQVAAPQGLMDRIMIWCWGDLGGEQLQDHQDEHVVQEVAADQGLVPEGRLREDNAAEGAEDGDADAESVQDDDVPELAAAAVDPQDPQDPEAIEDAEDFDGVMELIGLRGPLTGLFQNAMFSAVLLSATIGCGIWIPYVWGKVVVVVLAHPISLAVKLPLRWLSVIADLAVDLAVFSVASLVYWLDHLARLSLRPVAPSIPLLARYIQSATVAQLTLSMVERSVERIAKLIVATSVGFSTADYPIFSVLAHESLSQLKATIVGALSYCWRPLMFVFEADHARLWNWLRLHIVERHDLLSVKALLGSLGLGWHVLRGAMIRVMLTIGDLSNLKVPPSIPATPAKADPALISWTATDRIIAILAGYSFFCVIGALYVQRGTPFSTSEQGKRVETIVQSVLIQSGGILKVVLIIGVEMIVFPLYCGALLDLALLPLFDGATMLSRVNFTLNSPWTSAFVHWFIGTCYMFHFALFVSMCRRIMRNGVLYFIRDPDDPTFHPVRDVLERNVASQLRKIAFSALIYGALVIVCLGGIVWGIAHGFSGIFPIHWSSNEPILEFPVDLLFYNFLMPSAVKFFRPSDGFQRLYRWWFRKCARALRLTWFLFGERRLDEEGHHVRRTWWGLFTRKRGDYNEPLTSKNQRWIAGARGLDAYFVRDGRFVRTPGSDLVRIPKGGKAFQELDGSDDPDDESKSSQETPAQDQSDLYTKVYIPPMFGLRIGLFIVLIWLFAAITGVSVTILPLVLGRQVLASLIPHHLRMNDVYAFSIGLYILGGCVYGALHHRYGLARAKQALDLNSMSLQHTLSGLFSYGVRFVKLVYTFVAFAFVVPALFALLVELYFVIPVHTYLAAHERHFIDLIQDWTLGVLYVKLIGRLIMWYPHSRPARALQAITRHGWLNPDARLATRSVIVPATVVMSLATLIPLAVGWLAIQLRLDSSTGLTQSQVYRYSYPAVLMLGSVVVALQFFSFTVARWKQGIRDEVYLVGQRLHNLGESRAAA